MDYFERHFIILGMYLPILKNEGLFIPMFAISMINLHIHSKTIYNFGQ